MFGNLRNLFRGKNTQLTIKTKKFNKFLKKVNHYFSSGEIQKTYQQIIQENMRRTQRRFQEKLSPDGKRWKPNAPATIKKKGRDDALIDSGTMRNAFEYEVDKKGFSVKNRMSYAGIHQYGTNKIPARPFMGFEKEEIEKGMDLFIKAFKDM